MAPTHPVESGAGAKAFPVNEEVRQLSLLLETAEEPARAGADGGAARPQERAAPRAVPKSRNKRETAKPATIDSAAERLEEAFGPADHRVAPEVEHYSQESFTADLLKALRIARSAIQTLALAIMQNEVSLTNDRDRPIASFTVPDYE